MFQLRKARRQRRPLKICLEGLSGSGKTFTALRLAFAMRRAGIGRRIAVADSENYSASVYEGIEVDGEKWDYEVCPLEPKHQNPEGYADCYEFLVGNGVDIIIFDSLSHAWYGALEQVDVYAQKNRGDKFSAWSDISPNLRRMVMTLTDARAHCIATVRVKSDYERVQEGNRVRIQKIGLRADQRDNLDYEFDCVCRLDPKNHLIHVEKVRGCSAMDDRVANYPGPEFWQPLFDWWKSGEEVSPAADTAVEEARRRLAAATSIERLSAVWHSLDHRVQLATVGDKDARKKYLLSAQAGTELSEQTTVTSS